MFALATKVAFLSFFYLSFFLFGKMNTPWTRPFFCLLSNASQAELRDKHFHQNPLDCFLFSFACTRLYLRIFLCVTPRVSLFSPPPPAFIKYTCQSAVIIRTATGSVTRYAAHADWRSYPCKMPVKTRANSLKKSSHCFLFIITADVAYSLVIKVNIVFNVQPLIFAVVLIQNSTMLIFFLFK